MASPHPHQSPKTRNAATESETLPDVVEASVMGQDKPMEREHPKAPGAMIWFSYPLALVVMLAIAVVAFMILT